MQAVAQRCRDRDEAVRREAFALLARFLQPTLERWLQLPDWQAVLDSGLAGPLPGGATGKLAQKHAPAIRDSAQQLLLRFLGLPGSEDDGGSDAGGAAAEGGGSQDWVLEGLEGLEGEKQAEEEEAGCVVMTEGEEEEDTPSGRGCARAGSPAWVRQLRAVQPPQAADLLPQHSGAPGSAQHAAAVVGHLQAAWQEALGQVLGPEQLAAVGLGPGPDAGVEDGDGDIPIDAFISEEGGGRAADDTGLMGQGVGLVGWECEEQYM